MTERLFDIAAYSYDVSGPAPSLKHTDRVPFNIRIEM